MWLCGRRVKLNVRVLEGMACLRFRHNNSPHSKLNTQPSTLNTQHSTLDVRHSTLDTGRQQSSTTSLNLCRGSQAMTLPNWTQLPMPFLLITFGNLALSAHAHAQPRGRLEYNREKRPLCFQIAYDRMFKMYAPVRSIHLDCLESVPSKSSTPCF